jgi:hypothetical protein
MQTSSESAIILRRLAPLEMPRFVHKYIKTKEEDREAYLDSLTVDQQSRWLIWMMPFAYTKYMSYLNEYMRKLTEGPDAALSRLDHLIEASDMYKVCRAIANERKAYRLNQARAK